MAPAFVVAVVAVVVVVLLVVLVLVLAAAQRVIGSSQNFGYIDRVLSFSPLPSLAIAFAWRATGCSRLLPERFFFLDARLVNAQELKMTLVCSKGNKLPQAITTTTTTTTTTDTTSEITRVVVLVLCFARFASLNLTMDLMGIQEMTPTPFLWPLRAVAMIRGACRQSVIKRKHPPPLVFTLAAPAPPTHVSQR